MDLRLQRVSTALREPFVAGHGSVADRELLLVSLESDDGQVGYGEAAPLESYDGVSIANVQAALERSRETLADDHGAGRAQLLARCAEVVVLPSALAALDLALWDLEGRRAGVPVWRLLAGAPDPPALRPHEPHLGGPDPVEVNWTITAADRAGAAREAAQAREAGFGTVKAKVGIGDDAGRLAAVRAAGGPELRIRIDANGAWSPEEARAFLRALAPVGIELCEEPVHGVAAIGRLTSETEIPLAVDESAMQPGALDHRACALACLKIVACGGLTGLVAAARRARATGYEVYLASTLDGPLGISAALHAAVALGGPTRACGLATLGLFAGRSDPIGVHQGRITVPAGPGLGQDLPAWYNDG